MTFDVAGLLDELASAPQLPGARCHGRHELYDATIPSGEIRNTSNRLEAARATALKVCNACPALPQCRAWIDGLAPTQRPLGVVAGQVTTSRFLLGRTS